MKSFKVSLEGAVVAEAAEVFEGYVFIPKPLTILFYLRIIKNASLICSDIQLNFLQCNPLLLKI